MTESVWDILLTAAQEKMLLCHCLPWMTMTFASAWVQPVDIMWVSIRRVLVLAKVMALIEPKRVGARMDPAEV
jgi:hypothetical protein